jgi:hypothetical protein
MAATFPETARTRAAWALLWSTVRAPWKAAERTADLAEELGCARTAVSQWCTGADERMGPWSLLYDTCKLTGEAFPARVPEILRTLGRDLFGVEVVVELAGGRPTKSPIHEAAEAGGAIHAVTLAIVQGKSRDEVLALLDKAIDEVQDVRSAVSK